MSLDSYQNTHYKRVIFSEFFVMRILVLRSILARNKEKHVWDGMVCYGQLYAYVQFQELDISVYVITCQGDPE